MAMNTERIRKEKPLMLTDKERKFVANADAVMEPPDEVSIMQTDLEKQKQFVKYRYPKAVRSLYAKDFRSNQKKVGGKGYLFSTEKELGRFRSPKTNPFKVIEEQRKVHEEELYSTVRSQGREGRR